MALKLAARFSPGNQGARCGNRADRVDCQFDSRSTKGRLSPSSENHLDRPAAMPSLEIQPGVTRSATTPAAMDLEVPRVTPGALALAPVSPPTFVVLVPRA